MIDNVKQIMRHLNDASEEGYGERAQYETGLATIHALLAVHDQLRRIATALEALAPGAVTAGDPTNVVYDADGNPPASP